MFRGWGSGLKVYGFEFRVQGFQNKLKGGPMVPLWCSYIVEAQKLETQ